jgi:preprotein translocase subunit SecB
MANQNTQNKFTLHAQFIEDLSFERFSDNITSDIGDKQPNIEVNLEVSVFEIGAEIFKVVLSIKVGAKIQEKQIFMLELFYAGIIEIAANMENDAKDKLLVVECPGLLFPFARNIVAETIGNGGFTPILLSPFDFTELFNNQNKNNQNAG